MSSGLKYFLLLLLPSITHGLFAQSDDWFIAIEKYRQELAPHEFIDSVETIPYKVMVNNLNRSESLVRETIHTAESLGDFQTEASLAQTLGTVFYLQGKYDSSTFYNLRAIDLFDQLQMETEKGAALCNLGYQTKQRNLPQAFVLFREGIALLEKHKADSHLLSAYDNFGVLHELNNDLDSADYFYKKSLYKKELAGDTLGIPYSLNKIAQLHLLKGEFEKAQSYFDKAYKMRLAQDDFFGIAENESFYGDLYLAWNQVSKALSWYEKSIASAEALDYPFLKQYNYEQIAKCYELAGDYESALGAVKEAAAIKDRILNEKNSHTILELEERYKSAEKDRSISQLQAETAEKKLTIYIIVAVSLILLLLAMAYLVYARNKARAARDAAIIQEREAGLIAVFDATENERKRIAKDLHDGIGQQLSGLRMNWESLQHKISSDVPEQSVKLNQLTEILDEACRDVRTISHSMMPKVLQERGLVAAIEEMMEKSLILSEIQHHFEHFRVEGRRFDERIELSVYRICQELFNNVIKHSKATEVSTQLLMNKNHLVLIVEDNGVGFKSDGLNKDGIGMMNISSRLRTVNGEMNISSDAGPGTVATIRIPVK